MEKGKTAPEKTTPKGKAPVKPLVPEVASVTIKVTQEDANALANIADYLYSRPMNETETGVVFLRNLMQRINTSA